MRVKAEAQINGERQPGSCNGSVLEREEQPKSRKELIQDRGKIVSQFSRKMAALESQQKALELTMSTLPLLDVLNQKVDRLQTIVDELHELSKKCFAMSRAIVNKMHQDFLAHNKYELTREQMQTIRYNNREEDKANGTRQLDAQAMVDKYKRMFADPRGEKVKEEGE
jgi:hypothetical protein